MTRDEILSGLKSGRKLMCDRKDDPNLPWLLSLVADGTLTSKFIEFDEQSSALMFTWNAAPPQEETT